MQDAAKTHEKESCFEQDELCEQLGKIIVQPTVAEQTPQNSAPSAPPAKKLEAKKMDLFAMEQEILKNVKLIRHDGGVYYFNGKCYSAIRNDMDLLELVRRKVSTIVRLHSRFMNGKIFIFRLCFRKSIVRSS